MLHRPDLQPRRRPTAHLPRLAALCAGLSGVGCVAPKYHVAEDTGRATDAAVAAVDSGPLFLRYCSPMPDLPPASNPAPDWSCARPTLPGQSTPQVTIAGTFIETNVTRIEYCIPAFHNCAAIPFDPALGTFSLPSSQTGNGGVYWRRNEVEYSATLWHSLATVARLEVGSFWLFTREEVKRYLPAIPLPDGQGVAITGLRDCSGKSAAGARFAAVTAADKPTGTHFSITKTTLKPSTNPTDDIGTGGVFNIDAGSVTVYAYVADGCIVAESSVVIEGDRVAYVFLVPGGYGQ